MEQAISFFGGPKKTKQKHTDDLEVSQLTKTQVSNITMDVNGSRLWFSI